MKTLFRSAITGQIVTKEFAENLNFKNYIMKTKLEIVLYIFLIAGLAFLNNRELIDEVSVGLAVTVIGLARGFVYQKDKTNQERIKKEALQSELRQKELDVNRLKK